MGLLLGCFNNGYLTMIYTIYNTSLRWTEGKSWGNREDETRDAFPSIQTFKLRQEDCRATGKPAPPISRLLP